MKQLLFSTGGLLMLLMGAGHSDGVVIDFDSLAVGVQPGNVLAGSGVTFRSGDIPNAVAVGDVITLSNAVDEFEVVTFRDGAISPPNYANARNLLDRDMLIAFDTPVVSVEVTSDDAIEPTAEIVRLLALSSTGNADEFNVLDVDETVDDITTPDNILTVGGDPFSFALFQVTAEQEGFDNLTFIPVPEPCSGLLAMIAFLAMAGRQFRRSCGP